MNDQFAGMLGLARRAGKLSPGHDAAFESIKKGRAKVCFLCSDASDRLKREFERTVQYGGRNVALHELTVTSPELYEKTGIRAAVFTIDDERFAGKITEAYGGNG